MRRQFHVFLVLVIIVVALLSIMVVSVAKNVTIDTITPTDYNPSAYVVCYSGGKIIMDGFFTVDTITVNYTIFKHDSGTKYRVSNSAQCVIQYVPKGGVNYPQDLD